MTLRTLAVADDEDSAGDAAFVAVDDEDVVVVVSREVVFVSLEAGPLADADGRVAADRLVVEGTAARLVDVALGAGRLLLLASEEPTLEGAFAPAVMDVFETPFVTTGASAAALGLGAE